MIIMKDSFALKIYTKDGIVKEDIFGGKKVLHLGCGNSKIKGALGVDMLKMPAVDVVCDLDATPWSFESESIDLIFAHNVLEHVGNVVDFMNEVWRIGKDGSRVVIAVPYFRSTDAFTDPTHKHFFTANSLDYFTEKGGSLSAYGYTDRKFEKIGLWYGWPQDSDDLLIRMFKKLIYKYPKFYDQYISLILPVKLLIWELEIKK